MDTSDQTTDATETESTAARPADRGQGYTEVSPGQLEADGRFSDIFDAPGYGVPSSCSDLGSHTLAAVINWWRNCLDGGSRIEELLGDLDDIKVILDAFREAVAKDATLVTRDA